ncbi:MAG: L-seryl-tRNA(Sec) selenium transferase [Pirellulaceae bacterium]
MSNLLRNIPSVTELLEKPPLQQITNSLHRSVVVHHVRGFLDQLRSQVQTASDRIPIPGASELAERIAAWILVEEVSPLRPVVNATGILLHTGLGRAPLAAEAIEAMGEIAAGYASVELDLTSGQRSQRMRAVVPLLKELTGAEAAAVVNNNAGATLLTLSAVAAGKEVIVSRGQLVEIGGSYRLPDVMQASGAQLKEIGTTNKTRLADYENAIGPDTGALLQVHTSNYVIAGFSESTSLPDLVSLGQQHQLPVIDDIGSGALIDFQKFGIQNEPTVAGSIRAGADLVLFSGDKLLGGPQCGIIVGRQRWIEKITKHPLMRALRVDKVTLAGLRATLQLYRDPETACQRVPLLTLLNTSIENLRQRAERLAPQLNESAAIKDITVIEDITYLGGGSVPTQAIATCCLSLASASGSIDALAAQLRSGNIAVVGRIHQDRLLLDLRSMLASQDQLLVAAFTAL